MIVTTAMLWDQWKEYGDPAGKISRMKQSGELLQLTRGVYETDPNAPGHCLAGAILGPSYLSFDYALSWYGLIPEAVRVYTSATFAKRKAKEFRNAFGLYAYRDVPREAYPYGIRMVREQEYVFQIAAPEKALCDKLYTMPPVTSQREIQRMLFEDLRIDRELFEGLDTDGLLQIGGLYHCNNLKYLMKLLRRDRA